MKIKTLSLLSLVFGLFLFLSFYKTFVNVKPFSLNDPNNFLDKFTWDEISSGDSLSVFKGQSGFLNLKITMKKNLDPGQAKIYVNDKLSMIDSLFMNISSPYPGVLSNQIYCSEEFKPHKINYGNSQFYLLYASKRFTYGVCSSDLLFYRSVVFTLYCEKEKNLYFLEFFIPIDEDPLIYIKELSLIECA